MNEDWGLIVSSFQSEYGIRLSSELKSMSWREFSYMLQGLSGESPLGLMVRIRAEDDPEALKEFTPEQKRLRSEYRKKLAKKKTDREVINAIEQFKQAFIGMAKT